MQIHKKAISGLMSYTVDVFDVVGRMVKSGYLLYQWQIQELLVDGIIPPVHALISLRPLPSFSR